MDYRYFFILLNAVAFVKCKVILIDADAGADDALAILLMLSPLNDVAKLKAITCVTGNAGLINATRNTLLTLKVINQLKKIPVYKGSEQGLVYFRPSDGFFGDDGFGNTNPSLKPSVLFAEKTPAAEALVNFVNKYSGEVVLLCIGPLTNIAIALHLDPFLFQKVQNIYILGGNVNGKMEFNLGNDLEAAAFVFSKLPKKNPAVVITLDIVLESAFSMEWRIKKFGKIKSNPVKLLNLAERKILDKPTWGPADAYAAAAILDPSVIKSSKLYYAHVETCGPQAGLLLLNREKAPNVRVVKNFDKSRLKTLFLNYVDY